MGGVIIQLKRAYDPPAPTDGVRVVIDRLWPRGLSKRVARLDEWRRDLALSDALHKWYGHDPAKWPEFRRRYTAELKGKTAEPQKLARRARQEKVTLVFAASDVEHSNAFVLKSVLERLDE